MAAADDARRRRFTLLLYSDIMQVVFAGIAAFSGSVLEQHPAICYVGAASTVGPAILSVVLLIRDEWDVRIALAALALQSMVLVVVFAAIYLGGGVHATPAGNVVADALYFSVVTWTTLGYGDVTPLPALRLIAAMEAIYGYVFFGLIVGLIGGRFRR